VTAQDSLNSFPDNECLLFHSTVTDLQESRVSYEWITCPSITWCGPKTEHSLERFVCCILCIRRHGNAYRTVVWEWTIPAFRLFDTLAMQTCVNSATTVWLQALAQQWSIPICNGKASLPDRCLAMVYSVTIYLYKTAAEFDMFIWANA
jgi:hypothetical protein